MSDMPTQTHQWDTLREEFDKIFPYYTETVRGTNRRQEILDFMVAKLKEDRAKAISEYMESGEGIIIAQHNAIRNDRALLIEKVEGMRNMNHYTTRREDDILIIRKNAYNSALDAVLAILKS